MGAKKLHPCKIPGVKSKRKLHGPTLLTARAPSLVTAVTGGPVPVLPGSSGVVLPALLRRDLPPKRSPLCAPPSGFVSVNADFYLPI